MDSMEFKKFSCGKIITDSEHNCGFHFVRAFWIRNLIILYGKRTRDAARRTESEIRSEKRDLEEQRVWS